MSDYIDRYQFHLSKELELEQVRKIYLEIKSKVPNIEFSSDLEELALDSFDPRRIASREEAIRHEPRKWGPLWQMRYIGIVEVYLKNPAALKMIGPFIREGERQVYLAFEIPERRPFKNLVYEMPGLGYGLFPLARIVAEVTNAYLGIYGNAVGFNLGEPPKIDEYSGIRYQEVMLQRSDREWTSFYLDDALVKTIGEDAIFQYADFVQRSATGGYFIERHGLPLHGNMQKKDTDIERAKDRIYRERICPSIIERLRKEYRYDKNDRPL